MLDKKQQMEVFPTTIDLKRIDPSLNMRRFYRMSVQSELFGGACLVREWGRIGFRGQMLIEQHPDEGIELLSINESSGSRVCQSLAMPLPPAKTNVKSRAYGLKSHRKSANTVPQKG
ncbi:MAG: WGR domain-containing protein [Tritonibacter mobilis]|jgi:predicted DNA-binding WGR domain protein|uniref:WGR domain-containing protein n=2 Tax=Rhodobacterales TaxID=204455 RepID=A0ABY2WZ37_9RHOB|nr:WGR domain-containing protein [Tritonibacter mobilis]TMV08180.1 WGR domain-containing protein [Arenibacterium halophilum]GLQ29090.1 hypothetical protein GCM10007927_38930 [Sulfitobacter pacificus]